MGFGGPWVKAQGLFIDTDIYTSSKTMRKTIPKQIGEFNYQITQLGAKEGRRALGRLLRIAGPALGSLTGKGADLGTALAKVVQGLSDDDIDYFCDTFATQTIVEMGSKAPVLSNIFDAHFAGEPLDMCKWLIACLEVNFGSFLEQVGGALAMPAPAPVAE